MKKLIVLFFIAFLVVSCNDKKPTPFIEKSKMEEILYDIAMLYAINNSYVYTVDNDTIPRITINSIFNKHQVDSLSFTENNAYYINLNKGVYYEMQDRIYARIVINQTKFEVDDFVNKVLDTKRIDVKMMRNAVKNHLDELSEKSDSAGELKVDGDSIKQLSNQDKTQVDSLKQKSKRRIARIVKNDTLSIDTIKRVK
ncbi:MULTISPECIES: DUF4296 domain-containing protein [Myroides]|uniref:DUF4296 domain-containing protein n=1 Tax=Myroides albus TaxID=2562892 RepID=A0A6I3LJS1_9FLAO|nr:MULTISPECIES: DUF4296 domain-containing protein [Myroides]MTG98054.1 DUF4296 domain-containing protein [Myroides albus]MVX36308.1 DUF4296 domain-containing protein [Myroides sp. LoEW2-1]UVD80766.1 DUF4296 domain-containing protein [Myroides albus]